VEWIAHTLHQTHGRRAGIRTVPVYGQAMRGNLGISREIRTGRPRHTRCWRELGIRLPLLAHPGPRGRASNRSNIAFKMPCCTRRPNRCANDGYYEVHKQVCIDSRRSRLLWGSGNARRNRMDVGRGAGAGFPNPDCTNVGVLENRSIGRSEQSKSPTASTGGDVRCAMPL
jgi:hypothetical protein